MTTHSASLTEMPDKVPVLALLGLSPVKGQDFARIQAIQYAMASRVTRHRFIGHMLFAGMAALVYGPHIGWLYAVLWFAVLGVIQWRGYELDRKLEGIENRSISRGEILEQTIAPVLAMLVWGFALVVFAPMGPPQAHIALWTLCATLVAGAALLSLSAPLATVCFSTGVSLAAAAGFALQSNPVAAIAALLFGTISVIGAIAIARIKLNSMIARSGAAEKDEVVSLLLREFEENEADWLWQIDSSRQVRSVSPRFAYALGCSQTEAEGEPLLKLIAGPGWKSGRFSPSLHDLADRLNRRENFSNLLVEVTIKGERRWWELSGTPMRNEAGRFIGFRGVGSDVTVERESSEKIAYLARFDTLTRLPNRLQLIEALGDALRYAAKWRSRCGFMMVDLDRFKSVNDSLGHMVGDKLLAQVSQRLNAIMGPDQLCGRLGGDEFAIVLRDASDRKLVDTLARRIIDELSQPYEVDHHTLFVGASVGSAIGPRDGETVEEIMRNADLALYEAKAEGGGKHCRFEPRLHASVEERRQLEAALRKAIDRNELSLQFQPVVSAHSEDVVGFEALVRWHSEEFGDVSPAKFIPVAEDTRLIVPIGKWVLREACREAARWPEDIKVNVNVSPEQLLDPEFAREVVEILSSSGLAARRLEIEVTESIFLRDPNVARQALEQAMALGCSVALDDFGTGYSSLGYLRKLSFSTIKIDRTFVQGAIQNSAESLAIIRAVVAMAQSLGMTTTAEGVETSEEFELIRALGCDKIQGYYFGRPMAAEDARKLLYNRPGQHRALHR